MSPEPADIEPADIQPADSDPARSGAASSDVPRSRPAPAEVPAALEALLLLAEEPLEERRLADALGIGVGEVTDALAELVAFYDETGRGFELRAVAGGWRYYTREEYADLVVGFWHDGATARLSAAALETLAVVVYQQPISRARIAAVRGVSVDGVVRTLMTRGLIAESGQDPDSGAAVFVTTATFLERMGLRSLAELPPLAPHLPEADDLEAELSALAAPPAEPSGGAG